MLAYCGRPSSASLRRSSITQAPAFQVLGYQLPTTLRAAPCKYLTAVLSGHTCTEPMCACSTHFTRLIRTLHTGGSKDDPGRSKKGGKAKPLTAKASIDFLFFSLQHARRSV